MSDALATIASHVRSLLDRVKQLEQELRNVKDKATTNPAVPSAHGPNDPNVWQTYNPLVKVTEVSEDNTYFLAVRLVAVSGEDMWEVDADLESKALKVYLPVNMEMPRVDDIVTVTWLGLTEDRQPVYVLASGSGGRCRRFQLEEARGDYLTAREFDSNGSLLEQTHEIAKPYFLRQSPFDGQTIADVSYTYESPSSRTARTESGDAEYAEKQEIVVPYLQGDEILAMSCNTGVSGSDGQVKLLDMNVDARLWARAATLEVE